MSKLIEEVLVQAGELRSNPFREGLRGGSYDQSDLDEIRESITTHGWWGGIVGRRLSDATIQLGNGHRRVAAVLACYGPLQKLKTKLYDYTDMEMLRVLAQSNSYRNSSCEERLDLVFMASRFLQEYDEGYSGSVDFHLLIARSADGPQYEGPERLSNFLGKANWPKQRVHELLKQLDAKNKKSEGSTEETSHAPIETSVPPIHDSFPDSTGGILDCGTPSAKKEKHPVTPLALAVAEANRHDAAVLAGIQEKPADQMKSTIQQGTTQPAPKAGTKAEAPMTEKSDLFKSMTRLESIFMKKGLTQTEFIKQVESYLDSKRYE